MNYEEFEFWGYEKAGGRYDIISGGQRNNLIFYVLCLELMLGGYSTYFFRTEK